MLLRYNAYVVYADVRIAVFACHAAVPDIECQPAHHVSGELVGADRAVEAVVEL